MDEPSTEQRPLPTIGTWTLCTVSLLVVVGAILLVVNESRDSADPILVTASAVTTFYASLHLVDLMRRGEVRPLNATYWLFSLVALGFAPMSQNALSKYPIFTQREFLTEASLLVLASLVAWHVGYWHVDQRSSGRRRSESVARMISTQRVAILTVLGLLGSAVYVYGLGIEALFGSRQEVDEQLTQQGLRGAGSEVTSGLLTVFGQIPIFVALVALTVRLAREKKERTPRTKAWWLLLLIVNLIVSNPVSSPRFWVVTVLLGVLLALPNLRARGFRILLVGSVVGAIVVFPYADIFRYSPENRPQVEDQSLTEVLATKDYDQVAMFANGIWWVSARGSHTEGRQLLGAALFMVPREVWPDKPIDTGVEVGQALRTTNINLSSPLADELWVDFGAGGMVIGFVALGFFARRADDIFVHARAPVRGAVLMVDIFVPIVAAYEFIVLRGSLLQSMLRLASIVAVCWWISTTHRRSHDDRRQSEKANSGGAVRSIPPTADI